MTPEEIEEIREPEGLCETHFNVDAEHCPVCLYAALEEAEARVGRYREALEKVNAQLGWHGHGPDRDIYYCEHCSRGHEDYRKIRHQTDCAVLAIRRALREE